MSPSDSIVLIGYRATGKSTVAALLATALDRPVIDTDHEIRERTGRTIAEIFAAEGEAGFRALEHTVIAALPAEPPAVISVGGGAVLDPDNRDRLAALGPVVWLEADLDTLVRRLNDDPRSAADRPALGPDDRRTETARLLAARTPIYSAASTHRIDTTGRTPTEVRDAILQALGL